ncbi:recombination-associated protein RdgC [Alloalcanivorax sp. C16-1]|uniref:recombination-associated protein RdgC n=1 Tax=Alloalcanivorax sp. C16-1 TaxID=3390051 RepID=UPI003970BD45
MFFKNARIYRITDIAALAGVDIHAALEQHPASDPGAQSLSAEGWVSPYPGVGGGLILPVAEGPSTATYSVVMVHQEAARILPPAVIRDKLNERCAEIQKREGRPVGRKERADLKDQITFELLPQAFIKRTRTRLLMMGDYLVVDTASPARAEQVISCLRRALGTLPVQPLTLENSLQVVGTEWLRAGPPAGLELGDRLHLVGPDDCRAVFTNVDCNCEEVLAHLDQGFVVSRIEVANGELAFCLDADLSLRRVQMLDLVQEKISGIDVEHAAEEAEATYTIMVATLTEALDQMVAALGGEADAPGEMA